MPLSEIQSFIGVWKRDPCQGKFSRKSECVSWAWKEDHLNDRLNQGRQSRWKVSYQLKLEREINGKQCSMAAVWQGRVPTEQKKLACSIGAQS